MVLVTIIGDDLTGSNATGALYATRGLQVFTVADASSGPQPDESVDVLVFNTESRHLPREEAAARVARVTAVAAPLSAQIVKRIDTTLRGNIGEETLAALKALREARGGGQQVALVVPAFPASGRSTLGGRQLVHGVPVSRSTAANDPFTPVTTSRLADLFNETRTVEISLEELDDSLASRLAAAAESADIVVVDALSDADIRDIATAAANVSRRSQVEWLVVDTGPFGAALTEERIRGAAEARPPVLVLSGSLTARTRAQLDHLEAVGDARLITVDPDRDDAGEIVERLARAVAEGSEVVGVRTVEISGVPSGEAARRTLQMLGGIAARAVGRLRPIGVYATGGDVAMATLSTLGGRGFRIRDQVLPLAVIGEISGGPNDALGFATKGGLVGDVEAALACVSALRRGERRTQDAPRETVSNGRNDS